MTASFRISPNVASLQAPPVPEVQGWARAYAGALGPLIDLSQAVPGYPPHPDMLGFLSEAGGSVACTNYGAIEGEAALRTAYAGWVSELYGADLHDGNIQITSGCNQAFTVAMMAIAGHGDRVLLTNPCYFNHETTLAMLGIEAGYVDCHAEDGFLPRLDAVSSAIDGKVRALVVVSPNNPTGAAYSPELLQGLYDLCRQAGIWLIVDETYRDFLPVPAGAPHRLFSNPDWQRTLIGLYSFSKSFCIPGHRVGAMTAGQTMVGETAKIMDNLQICAPRPPQAALARAIPHLATWRAGNRAKMAGRATALKAAMSISEGWEISAIGAYFAFVQHPCADLGSTEVARRLAQQAGVVTIPGAFFGRGLERYLRFAFANADEDAIATLPVRLGSLGG